MLEIENAVTLLNWKLHAARRAIYYFKLATVIRATSDFLRI